MKKIFSILFLMVLTISCKCEETLTVFTLTEEEKATIPHQLHQTVSWVDDKNITHNGSVITITEDYTEGGGTEDCNRVQHNRLISYIQFNNFKYGIVLSKRNNSIISLGIHEYVNDNSTKYFTGDPSVFTTIEFNGETYENAILLKQSVLDDMPFGHLVFSKTNGIEFILFADGTWYKRVD